jgi:hypothetical protein
MATSVPFCDPFWIEDPPIAADCAAIGPLGWYPMLSSTFEREHCVDLGSMKLGRRQVRVGA